MKDYNRLWILLINCDVRQIEPCGPPTGGSARGESPAIPAEHRDLGSNVSISRRTMVFEHVDEEANDENPTMLSLLNTHLTHSRKPLPTLINQRKKCNHEITKIPLSYIIFHKTGFRISLYQIILNYHFFKKNYLPMRYKSYIKQFSDNSLQP